MQEYASGPISTCLTRGYADIGVTRPMHGTRSRVWASTISFAPDGLDTNSVRAPLGHNFKVVNHIPPRHTVRVRVLPTGVSAADLYNIVVCWACTACWRKCWCTPQCSRETRAVSLLRTLIFTPHPPNQVLIAKHVTWNQCAHPNRSSVSSQTRPLMTRTIQHLHTQSVLGGYRMTSLHKLHRHCRDAPDTCQWNFASSPTAMSRMWCYEISDVVSILLCSPMPHTRVFVLLNTYFKSQSTFYCQMCCKISGTTCAAGRVGNISRNLGRVVAQEERKLYADDAVHMGFKQLSCRCKVMHVPLPYIHNTQKQLQAHIQ